MNDYTALVNVIGSVGFPIVACGALFWMINTTMKELTAAIESLKNAINDMDVKQKGDV